MYNLSNVGELDRTTYIGSSDAAGIIEMSNWDTPLSVYMQKTGQGEPESDEKKRFFARRKRQEPVVLDALREERGAQVVRTNQRYRHEAHDFLAAEIDFEFLVTPEIVDSCQGIPPELIGSVQNGEIKTSHPWAGDKFGEEGTDEIPIQYCAQSMHGMMVTGRDLCLYAVMTGFDQFATYVLHRDQDVIDGLMAKELAFWNNHVIPRVPPGPSNNEDLMRLFSRHNGRPVEIDDETMSLYSRLKYLRSHAKAIEEEKQEIKYQIGVYIARQWGLAASDSSEDNAVLQYCGEKIGTWKIQSRTGLDAKALLKAHPDIAKEFQKTSYFRVLR